MTEQRLQMLVECRRVLIFDLFHTLTSLQSTGAARPRTADILGVPWDRWYEQLADTADERFIGRIQDPLEITRRLAHAIDPGIPEERIREATTYRLERFRDALVTVPEATEHTLVSLKAMGKRLGLISNADVVEAAGWDDSPIATLFDCVVFSCRVGYIKPQPEIYQLCLRDMEVSAEDSIFVGDGGSHELEGARGVGLTTVMITGHIKRVFPEKIEARLPYADFVIEHLDQLVTP